VRTTRSKAAAAARIGAGLGQQKRAELLALLQGWFARVEPWLQAGKYVTAVASGIARRNGWSIAEHAGDRAPDKTQRLLNRAAWDTFAAMSVVRRFAVAGLDEAARRSRRRCGLAVGAIDETSQVKHGTATAGVKRHYLGCVGKVANGITTVHLSYVRERTGHALIGARQWIPAEQITGPVTSLVMGLPDDLVFRTKGQLAIDICTDALADSVQLDFLCGDEVYGNCTELREFCEEHGQGYVLRVPSSFRLTLARGVTLTCAQAVTRLLNDARRWEVRSAGPGSKGQRWYAWAWLATASSCHYLLIRRHLATGELAFHYCYVPQGQPVSKARLIRAAGYARRWAIEMVFPQLAKGPVRAVGGGRQHVADLNLAAGDDYAVDEQFGELPPLGEGGGGQPGPDGLAECLDPVGDGLQFQPLPGGGVQLPLLGQERGVPTVQFLTFAFQLGQVHHLGQVGVQLPLPLALQLAQGVANGCLPGLEFLRQPGPPRARASARATWAGSVSSPHRSAQTSSSSCPAGM
jgi:SRSO17 transposase